MISWVGVGDMEKLSKAVRDVGACRVFVLFIFSDRTWEVVGRECERSWRVLLLTVCKGCRG